ncbi:hypothetical protein BKA70DRAFT_1119361 [Coprinopsis sp. MPI-PUGE-AT-0042]|nr:hypothetical protein BKA70DRAFT_1119361 [Coprinopsis sp. MPI-PUGE-AT-0042]
MVKPFEKWISSSSRVTLLFFSLLSFQQLGILQSTCRTVARVVIAYKKFAWSSERFLQHWFSNPSLFIVLMELTGAIVGGVQTLAFAERQVIHPSIPLDIFIRIGAADAFREYLIASGFTVAFPCLSGLLPISLRRLAAMASTPSTTIIEEIHFYKTGRRTTGKPHLLAVRVIVVNVDPVDYITTSQHSS